MKILLILILCMSSVIFFLYPHETIKFILMFANFVLNGLNT
jgi:hypothetical protein